MRGVRTSDETRHERPEIFCLVVKGRSFCPSGQVVGTPRRHLCAGETKTLSEGRAFSIAAFLGGRGENIRVSSRLRASGLWRWSAVASLTADRPGARSL